MNTLQIALFYTALIALVFIVPSLTWLISSKRQNGSRGGAVLVALGLSALTIIAADFDSWLGLSSSWVFCLAFIVFGTGVSTMMWFQYRLRANLLLAALFVIGILSLHFYDLTPVKPYKRFYNAIQEGITEPDVRSLLAREFSGSRRFHVPVSTILTSNCMSFRLDPTDGRYNAEIISLRLEGGMVTQKTYWSD